MMEIIIRGANGANNRRNDVNMQMSESNRAILIGSDLCDLRLGELIRTRSACVPRSEHSRQTIR